MQRQLRKIAFLAFVQWIEVAVRRRRVEELRERALRGMLDACIFGALKRWKMAVKVIKIERATLRAGAICWVRREVPKALRKWRTWAVNHGENRVKHEKARQHAGRRHLVRGFRG